jgi:uncharacterized protein (DUF58 family)
VRPPVRPIEPAAEAALRRLELVVGRRLDGLLFGDHLGRVPGLGSEPADSRPYRVGDDVRRMDWAVTARTTQPHVREVVADRELETTVLADLSASLEFGTAQRTKRELAITAVAAVGALALRGGDRLGALVLHDGSLRELPARSGRLALRLLLHRLAELPETALDRPVPGRPRQPTTDLAAMVDRFARARRRRGLVVVISDFLTPPGWERPLRLLAARHAVLAVEVVDPRELELPDVGMLRLVDPETGRLLEVQTSSRPLRQRYATAAAEARGRTAAALRRAGARHLLLRTDRDWLRDMVGFVATARRTAGARR